jgi:pimeloyl-ACP methyl ester carboxylesterase
LKIQSSPLKVPGAQLYYEVQGTGPVLLMISCGPTDAGIFAGLARFLADRYTVVTYDPRGNSRSVLDGPPEDQRTDVHGGDAAQLLAALSGEPANVLGSSGGAQIGLNLAARYPHRVHTLVAHEPPCVQLLHAAAEQRAFTESVYNTYRADGVGHAEVHCGRRSGRRPTAGKVNNRLRRHPPRYGRRLPLKRDAEKAVAALRSSINAEVRVPQTVAELIIHYCERELARKAYASQENYLVLTKRYIEPRWGNHQLSQSGLLRSKVGSMAWISLLRRRPK